MIIGKPRRQSSARFLRVVEAQKFHLVRKKFFCEGGLACAVAAADEVDGGPTSKH